MIQKSVTSWFLWGFCGILFAGVGVLVGWLVGEGWCFGLLWFFNWLGYCFWYIKERNLYPHIAKTFNKTARLVLSHVFDLPRVFDLCSALCSKSDLPDWGSCHQRNPELSCSAQSPAVDGNISLEWVFVAPRLHWFSCSFPSPSIHFCPSQTISGAHWKLQ